MAKSDTDHAIEFIDAKIHDLERAKEIILGARQATPQPPPSDKPKRRGRKPRTGLPTTANVDGV